jgi:hypothetical protein
MKITCINCKAVFQLVSMKGKGINDDVNKVVIRCMFCIDMLAYHPIKAPETDAEKEEIKYRHMFEYVTPRAHLCGVTGAGQLKCSVCPLSGDKRPHPNFCKVAIPLDAMVSGWVEKQMVSQPSAEIETEPLDAVDQPERMKYEGQSLNGQDIWIENDD